MYKDKRNLSEKKIKWGISVFLRWQNRPLQDLIFALTLLITLSISTVSLCINSVLDLPLGIQYHNYFSFVFLIALVILTHNEKYIKTARYLYIAFLLFSLNFLWLRTQGSSGPMIIFTQALLPLILFAYAKRELYISVVLIALNVIALFYVEITFPQIFTSYASLTQRSLDVFTVIIIFLSLELPLLIYARNSLLKERNKAVNSERAKTSFIANLSHEIRTPMNAILGFTELLSDSDIKKADQENYLKIVNQNGRILMSLLNNIINLSKIESNQAQAYISKCDVKELLYYVSETLQPLTQSPNLELIVDETSTFDIAFESDNSLLFQILINLGYNAVKFTDKGSITIGAHATNNTVLFTIKDTGCGIPEDQQKSIFERFRQLETSTSMTPTNGAGLGLSICLALTHLLNGQIWFASEEHVGTTFFVELPLGKTDF